jgi:hypothetical protein
MTQTNDPQMAEMLSDAPGIYTDSIGERSRLRHPFIKEIARIQRIDGEES